MTWMWRWWAAGTTALSPRLIWLGPDCGYGSGEAGDRRRRGDFGAGLRRSRCTVVPVFVPGEPVADSDPGRSGRADPTGATHVLVVHTESFGRGRTGLLIGPPSSFAAVDAAIDEAAFAEFYRRCRLVTEPLWPTLTDPLISRSEARKPSTRGRGRRRRRLGSIGGEANRGSHHLVLLV